MQSGISPICSKLKISLSGFNPIHYYSDPDLDLILAEARHSGRANRQCRAGAVNSTELMGKSGQARLWEGGGPRTSGSDGR